MTSFLSKTLAASIAIFASFDSLKGTEDAKLVPDFVHAHLLELQAFNDPMIDPLATYLFAEVEAAYRKNAEQGKSRFQVNRDPERRLLEILPFRRSIEKLNQSLDQLFSSRSLVGLPIKRADPSELTRGGAR